MHIDKRTVLLVLMTLTALMPCFGQRFTKKEQALREARQINYFYGNSFTLSAGYVHSWLTADPINITLYGLSGSIENTRESFGFNFAWDHSTSRTHGFQLSASYAQFGGEKLVYFSQNYGPQLRPDQCDQIHLSEVLLDGSYRYFIPLTYKSRLTFSAGLFIGRFVGGYDSRKDWDMGPIVGVGYDWKHLSVGVRYIPGVYGHIIDDSDTRLGALMFNVGVHLWK